MDLDPATSDLAMTTPRFGPGWLTGMRRAGWPGQKAVSQASLPPGNPSARKAVRSCQSGVPRRAWPIVMVSIVCKYSGALRCQADHGPSHSRLETDAPLDNQGKGERFSPTDLVATALASCILTVMGIMAERHGWALEGCSARVEKTMTTSGRRKIAKLEVWIQWPVGLEDQAKAVLQRAAEGCPVKESLEGTVAMELHWI